MASLLGYLSRRGGRGGLLGGLPAPPESGEGSPAGGPGNVAADNPLTLMALGAGIAKGGIGGIGAAVPAAALEQQQRAAQQAHAATFAALRAAGMPGGAAAASALNPEMLRALAPEFFGGFKVVQTGADSAGNKIFKLQGPGGHLYDIAAPGTPGAAGPLGPTSAPAAGNDAAVAAPTASEAPPAAGGNATGMGANDAAPFSGPTLPAGLPLPTPQAVAFLKKNPAAAAQFDAAYGAGSAARILRPTQP